MDKLLTLWYGFSIRFSESIINSRTFWLLFNIILVY